MLPGSRSMIRLRHVFILSLCLSAVSSAAQFGDFTYTDEGVTITINDYPTTATGAVVVPATIDGKPVTRIGDSAFTDCKQITSISLPASLTHLGVTAFEQCHAVASITIPSGVVSIGRDCFYGCKSLASVSIPDSVTEIGVRAFAGCGSLETVNLPANLTVIPETMFLACPKLTQITIPPGVETISGGAFSQTGLTSVTFPPGLKTLGSSAFAHSKIQSLTIPATLTEVGSVAFADCGELTSVTIVSASTRVGYKAFGQCAKLTAVNLPPTQGDYGQEVFTGCDALVSVEIPAGWTSLPVSMFSYCQSLERAVFLGNAPASLHPTVFSQAAPAFKIYYQPGATGFTSPVWQGYPAEMLDPEIEVGITGGNLLLDGGSPLTLGNAVLGTSVTRQISIRNTGNVALENLALSQEGPQVSEFTVSSLGKTVLEPGESQTFDLTFTPLALGTRSSALHIASNDVDENPFDILLTGNSVPEKRPEISVTHPAKSELVDGRSKKSFGTVQVGSRGNAKVFTIRNAGTAALSGIQVRTKGGHQKDFIIPALGKTSLKPGASLTFKVIFQPGGKGQRTSSLQIRSNDADESPFDIKLSGFGASVKK